MPPRRSLDDKLAAIRALKGRELTDEDRADLKKWLGDRSNLVVASAAALAGEGGLAELAPDLEAAFDRFLVDPVKVDKLCRAKLAIVQALDRLEHIGPIVFEKAARHVQMEPAWGREEDSAPPLRSAGLVALARVEGTTCLPLLVDALTDPAAEVRGAAAVALGAIGTEAAGLVLRLKARLGDADPDALGDCLGGLLAVDPSANLPLVAGYLDPLDEPTCEAAALALGRSRLAEALGPLRACWERAGSPELRHQLLLAIAVLRRPAGVDLLAEILAPAGERDALDALAALEIAKDDPRLRDRVAALVESRDSPTLRAAFERGFR